MDENRVEGTARDLGGKVQEGVGRFTGNTETQAEGVINQAAGRAQDLYGQTADAARQTASSLNDCAQHRGDAALHRSGSRAGDRMVARQDAPSAVAFVCGYRSTSAAAASALFKEGQLRPAVFRLRLRGIPRMQTCSEAGVLVSAQPASRRGKVRQAAKQITPENLKIRNG